MSELGGPFGDAQLQSIAGVPELGFRRSAPGAEPAYHQCGNRKLNEYGQRFSIHSKRMKWSDEEVFNRDCAEDDREPAGAFTTEPGACDYRYVEKQISSHRSNALQKRGETEGHCYKRKSKSIAKYRGSQSAWAGI